MAFIGKTFAILMLPISVLILLEALNIFKFTFAYDKIMIGAVLMILLQLITMVMVYSEFKSLKIMNVLMFCVFVVPAAGYLLSKFIALPANVSTYLPFIIGMMMLIESLYALH